MFLLQFKIAKRTIFISLAKGLFAAAAADQQSLSFSLSFVKRISYCKH